MNFGSCVRVEVSSDWTTSVVRSLAGRPCLALVTPSLAQHESVRKLGSDLRIEPIVFHESLLRSDELTGAANQTGAIVAIGGGSVIDAAKLIGYGFRASSESLSLLASGKARVPERVVPVLAVPTTSGSGSEMTPFATVWDRQHRRKYSLEDRARLFPEVAILDPSLTMSLPFEATVSSGLDAIAQAFDSVCSSASEPTSVDLCVRSLSRTLLAFPKVLADLTDVTARKEMLVGSSLAGAAIATTRTGLAHAISYPLTAHLGVPHGLACGFALDRLMKLYASRDDGRLHKLGRSLGLRGAAGLVEVLQEILSLCRVKQLLGARRIQWDRVRGLLQEMDTAGRADNVFISISRHEISEMIQMGLAPAP